MGLNEEIRRIQAGPPPPTAEESLNDINSKVSTSSEQVITNELIQDQIDNSPLTDSELRATPVPVSGPLTNAEIRATPVPISGTVTANVDTSLLATKDNQTNGNQKVQVTNQYLDAFGLVKVGQPANRFDAEFCYDKLEEVFDEVLGSSGGSVTHNADARHLLLASGGTTTNHSATMRSYPVPYTPGNSQTIEITGVLNYAAIAGGTAQLFLRSKVTGTVTEQVVNQADWDDPNLDVDWTDSHIFDMDFQSLKVGRIRYRMVRQGLPVQIHEICNDNLRNTGYWQNPSLPVYWRIYNDATYSYMEMGYGNESNAIGIRYRVAVNALATMTAICATVKSGGANDLLEMGGYPQAIDMGVTPKTVSTSIIPLLSVRQRATFNSIENLSIMLPEELSVQTNNPVRIVIYHDCALTGASWVNVDTSHSTIEYDVTASAITGGHIIQSEYVATSKNIQAAAKGLLGKAVLWHRQNGNTGILTVAAVRSDATNASTLVGIKWKEIR